MALPIVRTADAVEVVHWSDPDVTTPVTVRTKDGDEVPISWANQDLHPAYGWILKSNAAVGPGATIVKMGPLGGQRWMSTALMMGSDDVDQKARGNYLVLSSSIQSATGAGKVDVADALMAHPDLVRGLRFIAICLTQGTDPWAEEVQPEGASKSAADTA